MLARPVNVLVVADFEKQVEVFRKERVVIVEPQTKERKRIDERASAGDDFRTAAGYEVDGCKFLKHAHGIGRTENRHRAGKAYALRARGGGAQDDSRRRIQKVRAMVLPDPKGVEADLVGELDLFDQVPKAVAWIDCTARIGVCRSETIDADLHWPPPAASSTDDE